MKRIVIEMYALDYPYVGVGEVCRQIGIRIGRQAARFKRDYGIEFYFVLSPRHCGCFGSDIHYICIPIYLHFLLPFYPKRVDLFHMPHQYCRLKRMCLSRHTLLTIHDVNFMYERNGAKLQRGIKRFKKKLQLADSVNYISSFAKEDAHRHFSFDLPERVIYNGVTNLACPENFNPARLRGLPSHYLFHISSLQQKKNVHLLVEMMRYLPNEHLVIAGDWKSNYGASLLKKIRELPVHNVTPLPDVDEDEKAWLYKHCKAFLFPSLCEGFGLPPIEAMKQGKPVFLSELTSLPEIGGAYAFYWKDLSPDKMAEVLQERLPIFYEDDGNTERVKAYANRFDWDECVKQYLDYYLDILKDE